MRTHIRLGIVISVTAACGLVASAAEAELECRKLDTVEQIAGNGAVTTVNGPLCDEDEVAVGGDCNPTGASEEVTGFNTLPDLTGFNCIFRNENPMPRNVVAATLCCKVNRQVSAKAPVLWLPALIIGLFLAGLWSFYRVRRAS